MSVPRRSSALGRHGISIAERLAIVEARPTDAEAVAAEAKTRAASDAAEVKAREDALAAEAATRSKSDDNMAKAMADETAARIATEKTLMERQTRVETIVTVPSGVSVPAGKTYRLCAVAGLKVGDTVLVSPIKDLPANFSIAESLCTDKGVLRVGVVAQAIVTLTAKLDIPIVVVIFR